MSLLSWALSFFFLIWTRCPAQHQLLSAWGSCVSNNEGSATGRLQTILDANPPPPPAITDNEKKTYITNALANYFHINTYIHTYTHYMLPHTRARAHAHTLSTEYSLPSFSIGKFWIEPLAAAADFTNANSFRLEEITIRHVVTNYIVTHVCLNINCNRSRAV